MRILVLGSGGREHAIGWKISQSEKLEKLFIAPGNGGTQDLGENLNLSVGDFESIKKAVIQEKIDMLVVGPEDPLVQGIRDFFEKDPQTKDLKIIGPGAAGAQLEGSKDFSKSFMQRHGIPTAKHATFQLSGLQDGQAFLSQLKPPYVLKADGLAAGKGVLILENLEEARTELANMLQGKFGKASERVVIEEYLDGIECSVFVLTDGKDYLILPEAKDYKRIGEGDTGLNTGGMGAISPVPFADDSFMKKVEEQIVKPSVQGLANEKIPYTGFLFIGLMAVEGNPYVIEYNVRMGDPETEVVMPRIQNDLVELLSAAAEGRLGQENLETNPETAATLMMVSGGYPEAYEKEKEISGLDQVEDSLVFHAGTKLDQGKLLTAGGRVLAITSFGKDHKEALSKSYANARRIQFDKAYYRKDLGFDLD